MLSPEDRAKQRSFAGRLGALRRWALHPTAPAGVTRRASETFRDSFLIGHGCRMCPPVTLPDDLTDGEREASAERLRQEHYLRLARRGAEARKGRAS